jgi:hypothetical protein
LTDSLLDRYPTGFAKGQLIKMIRTIDAITAELNSLKPRDFNLHYTNSKGAEQLSLLTDELAQVGEPDEVADILLRFIERLSNTDEIDPRYDLGTPGPLVHTLEKLPNYQKHLRESIKRQPTPLTIWMINRILNATKNSENREFWLNLLRDCLQQPNSTPVTRKEAQKFLEFQAKVK